MIGHDEGELGQTLPNPPWPLPVRAVIEVGEGGFTPFNLVPSAVAAESHKLLAIACLPLHGFGSSGPAPHWGEQLAVEFWNPGDPADQIFGLGGLIWWARTKEGIAALRTMDPSVLSRCIVVIDDDELFADTVAVRQTLELADVVLVTQREHWTRLPTALYSAVLEIQLELMPEAKLIQSPGMWSFPANVDEGFFTSRDWLAAGREGDSSPDLNCRPKQQLSGDLIVRPNQMLLAHGLGQVPDLDLVYVPSDPPGEAADLARAVLQVRRRRALLEFAGVIVSEGGISLENTIEQMAKVEGPALASLLEAALRSGRATRRGKAALAEFFTSPQAWRPESVVPQLVLACPSTSIAMARQSTFQRGPSGGVDLFPMGDELSNPYAADLLERVAHATGRYLQAPEPESAEDEEILKSVVGTVKSEANWISAMAFLVGARFGAPVLKLPRFPEATFDLLTTPTGPIDKLGAGASPEDWRQAASAVREVGRDLVERLPKPYGDLIDELDAPWIHCLSDVPMELMERHGDLLAYQAALSRCPITPGLTSLRNLYSTSELAPLPAAHSRVVIATPFDDDEAPLELLLEIVRASFPEAELETVANATSLAAVLESPDTAALIYVGHAAYDADNEETVLHLKDDTFGTLDVRRLSRVPPLAILVGCSTSGAGSTLGNMSAALLLAGTRGVVGTTYPVRKSIAYQFLAALLRQLTATERGKPVDLARALLIARRNFRFFSDITVLLAAGRVTEEEADELVGQYAEAVAAEPSDPDRGNLLDIEARLLAAAGVISSAEAPPASWEIVPFPAFFCVMGLPWTSVQAD